MSKEQKVRIGWCLCHALVAAYVLYSAEGSLALTALSHLIFFDAISATICVVVDVFCNFEVWKRSSIRHPFGYVHLHSLEQPEHTLLTTPWPRTRRSPRRVCNVRIPPLHGLRPHLAQPKTYLRIRRHSCPSSSPQSREGVPWICRLRCIALYNRNASLSHWIKKPRSNFEGHAFCVHLLVTLCAI